MLSTDSCGSDSDGVHTLSEISVDVLFQAYHTERLAEINGCCMFCQEFRGCFVLSFSNTFHR